jgi:hypothetical protein
LRTIWDNREESRLASGYTRQDATERHTMARTLPKAITGFLTGLENHNPDAAVRGFATGAVVKTADSSYRGAAAIHALLCSTTADWAPVTVDYAMDTEFVVTAGNHQLQFFLEYGRITFLSITSLEVAETVPSDALLAA